MSNRVDLDSIKDRLLLSELVGRTVALKKRGAEFWGLCPFHGEKTPSFKVNDQKSNYHCFGCGVHGDVVDWIAYTDNLAKGPAIRRAAELAGLDPDRPLTDVEKEELRRQAEARQARERAARIRDKRRAETRQSRDKELWRLARSPIETPVETYLRARGITIEIPPTIRFAMTDYYAPPLEGENDPRYVGKFPAMVAAIQAPDRSIMALHRTFLEDDGSAKREIKDPDTGAALPSKKVTGPFMGGAIRFAPTGPRIAIAEGIETALSVLQSVPDLAVWCGVSKANIAGASDGQGKFHPDDLEKPWKDRRRLPSTMPDLDRPAFLPPPECFELVILADNDSKDPHSILCDMTRAAMRASMLGFTARIAWPAPGKDFNDVLKGPTDASN